MKGKRLASVAVVLGIGMMLAGCGHSNDSSTMVSVPVAEDSDVTERDRSNDAAQGAGTTGNHESAADVGDSNLDMNSGEIKLLLRLEEAYNNRDLYGIIECFDPAFSNAFFAAAKIMGIDSDSVKNMMPFASKMISQSNALDDSYWGTVELTPLEILDDGISSAIKYQVDITYEDGSNRSFEDIAAIVEVEDIWYLSAFQSMKESEYAPIPVNSDITETDVEGELFIIGNASWGRMGILTKAERK